MLALHWACWGQSSEETITFLCEAYREAANIRDRYGRLPIHLACEYGTDAEVLNALLHANPMSIQSLDKRGRTPLDIVHEMHEQNGGDADDAIIMDHTHHTNEDTEKQPSCKKRNNNANANNSHNLSSTLVPVLQKKQLLQHNSIETGIHANHHGNSSSNNSNNNHYHSTAASAAYHPGSSSTAGNHSNNNTVRLQHAISTDNASIAWTPSTSSVALHLEKAQHESIQLHNLIERREWSKVLLRIRERPEDSTVWYSLTHSTNAQHTQNGEDLTVPYFLPIHRACRRDPPIEVIYALLQACPDGIGCRDSDGMLPMHWAASTRASSNNNQHNHSNNGTTATPAITITSSVDLVKYLLKGFPGSVGIKDKYGRLPLHLACEHGAAEEVIEILLEADPNSFHVKDKKGRTPLDFAKERDYSVVQSVQSFHNKNAAAYHNNNNSDRKQRNRSKNKHNNDSNSWRPSMSQLSVAEKKEMLLGRSGTMKSAEADGNSSRHRNNHHGSASAGRLTPSSSSRSRDRPGPSPTPSSSVGTFNNSREDSTSNMSRTGRRRKTFSPPEHAVRESKSSGMHSSATGSGSVNTSSGKRSVSSLEAIIKQAESHGQRSTFSRSSTPQKEYSSGYSSNGMEVTTPQTNNMNGGDTSSVMYKQCSSSNRSVNNSANSTSETTTCSLSTSVTDYAMSRSNATQNSDVKSDLYRLIETKCWKSALSRLKSHPEEAGRWFESTGSQYRPRRTLPLHRACQFRPPEEVVHALINIFPKALESKGNKDWLPLHYACAYAAPEAIIEILVEAYPSSLTTHGKGGTPLNIAECYYEGDRMEKAAIIEILQRDPASYLRRSDPSLGASLLLEPIDEVELSSSDNSMKIRVQRDSPSPLGRGEIDVVGGHDDRSESSASSRGYVNLDGVGSTEPTQLFLFIEREAWGDAVTRSEQHSDEAGLWVIRKDFNGECWLRQLPLHAASMRCPPFELVSSLLKSFPTGARMKDHRDRLPLHWACENGASTKVIEALVNSFPSSIQATDNDGNNPLACAERSKHPSKVAIVTYLMMNPLFNETPDDPVIQSNVSTSKKDNYFSRVSSRNSKSELFMLIEAKEWFQVLHKINKNPEDALVGCSVGESSRNAPSGSRSLLPLHRACQFRPPVDVVRALIQAAPQAVRCVGGGDWLPIHYACAYGAPKGVIALLIEAFPSSIHVQAKGGTPLQIAECYYEGSQNEKTAVIDVLQHSPTTIIGPNHY